MPIAIATVVQAVHDYTCSMLWIKALHIVFIASWFAGLFYLPRIFVNLAMVAPDSLAERDRLLLMAGKLYRFMTILAVPALVLGLWLWLVYGIMLGAWPIIAANVPTLGLAGTILVVKLRNMNKE